MKEIVFQVWNRIIYIAEQTPFFQLESLSASLETETRGRAELVRAKKKLETDLNDLELGCDQANRANADAQRTIRQLHDSVREAQQQADEEQRNVGALREQLHAAERRIAVAAQEKEDLAASVETTERARRQAELERAEATDALNALTDSNSALGAAKRKHEAEMMALQTEATEAIAELKAVDERGRKAAADAARLADELRAEQEHSAAIERARKAAETALRDAQQRLDEEAAFASKGGKRHVAKLEGRVTELETELDAETRRHADTQKSYRNRERRCRELQFTVDEDKKSQERMYSLVEQLQNKIKTYKRQASD